MALRPDPQTLLAFARVAKTPDGEALIRYLETLYQSEIERLAEADVVRVPKLQGRATVWKELTQLLRDSPQLVER